MTRFGKGVVRTAVLLFLTFGIHGKPPKIQFFSGPAKDKIPFQSETLNMHCKAVGDPKPSLSFLRNGTKLPIDSRITYTDTSVVIQRVEYTKDDGRYQCLAENKDGATLSREIFIKTRALGNFVFPFRYNDQVRVVDVTVGRPLELRCPAYTYTHPKNFYWGDVPTTGRPIIWSINQKRYVLPNGNLFYGYLENSDVNEINNNLKGVRCILYIAGKYKASVKTTLRVAGSVLTEFPPFLRLSIPPVSRAVEGKEYKLICATGGNPLPSIKWYKDGREIVFGSDSNIVTQTKQELIIKRVSAFNAGTYSCQVTNRLSTIQSKGRLDVVTPPKWKTKLYDIGSRINKDVKFRCLAEGTPLITYEWFWNGKKIYTNASYEVMSGALTIKNVGRNNSGIVQCLARNNYGSIISSSYLRVGQGPLRSRGLAWEWIVIVVVGILVILGAIVASIMCMKYKQRQQQESEDYER